MEHTNTRCGQNAEFQYFEQVVREHREITTDVKYLIFVCNHSANHTTYDVAPTLSQRRRTA
jgi:hypothetical protein